MEQKKQITGHDIKGLWKRKFIKIPALNPIHEDHETEVYWFQADGLFADLRIPSLIVSGSEDEALLSQCEGFAGISTVSDNKSTWHRHINLQGPLEGEDVGILHFSKDGLYETGLDDAYLELWQPIEGGKEVHARHLQSEDGWVLILVQSRQYFLLAIDQPQRLNHPVALRDAPPLPAMDQRPTYCFGTFSNQQAIVRLANQPTLFGKAVFTQSHESLFHPLPALTALIGQKTWAHRAAAQK